MIVRQRITSQRLIPTAMETRGVIAEWRAGERSLTLHSSTQIPHLLRTLVAGILGMPENLLRVITPEVGGGFGSKLNVYAEEALMAFIAMKIGKPVKWVESRRENFLCTIHGRGHVDYFELAAKRDGTMLGLRLKIDSGPGRVPPVADAGDSHAERAHDAGPVPLQERVRGHRRRLHQLRADRCVSRRGTSRGHARHRAHGGYAGGGIEDGPGGTPAEEFRARRRVSVSRPRPGLSYDSGDYEEPLRKALDEVDYTELRAEQETARAAGKLMGIGISTYGEICAMGPSIAMPAGGWEIATVKVEPIGKGHGADRRLAARAGRGDHVRADRGGRTGRADMDDVLVIHGDTAMVQYGIGTFGSRGTAVGGTALYYALQDLKAKMKKFGAMLLESEDVKLGGGLCTDAADRQIGHLRRNGGGRVPRQEAAAEYRARAWSRRTSGSRRTSPSPSARTSWSPKWTAIPATSRFAATWPWTIAAASSTR